MGYKTIKEGKKILFGEDSPFKSEGAALDFENERTNEIGVILWESFFELIQVGELSENDLIKIFKGHPYKIFKEESQMEEVKQEICKLVKTKSRLKLEDEPLECMVYALLGTLAELGKCKGYRARAEKAERYKRDAESTFNEWSEAINEFKNETGNGWAHRAKSLLTRLGITTGKSQSKTDKNSMFSDYKDLITGSEWDWNTFRCIKKQPLSKQEALEVLKNKYGLNSANACLEQLRVFNKEQKERLKSEGFSTEVCPNILPGKNPYKD